MKRREFVKALAALSAAGIGVRAEETAALPRRKLGKTGVEVSALALGGVIGMQLPPTKDHDPSALAEAVLDLGITYFDTAPAYNNGQSETNYGPVLARRRKEVFLATKTGDRSCDGTLRSVEQSLKRLRTDHVDLLQVHGVGPNDQPEKWDKPDGVLTALRKLREQKVIRFFGVTGHESPGLAQGDRFV